MGGPCQATSPVTASGRAGSLHTDYYAQRANCFPNTPNIGIKKWQYRKKLGVRVDMSKEEVWCVWILGAEFPDPMGNSFRSRFDRVNILFSAIG